MKFLRVSMKFLRFMGIWFAVIFLLNFFAGFFSIEIVNNKAIKSLGFFLALLDYLISRRRFPRKLNSRIY